MQAAPERELAHGHQPWINKMQAPRRLLWQPARRNYQHTACHADRHGQTNNDKACHLQSSAAGTVVCNIHPDTEAHSNEPGLVCCRPSARHTSSGVLVLQQALRASHTPQQLVCLTLGSGSAQHGVATAVPGGHMIGSTATTGICSKDLDGHSPDSGCAANPTTHRVPHRFHRLHCRPASRQPPRHNAPQTQQLNCCADGGNEHPAPRRSKPMNLHVQPCATPSLHCRGVCTSAPAAPPTEMPASLNHLPGRVQVPHLLPPSLPSPPLQSHANPGRLDKTQMMHALLHEATRPDPHP